MGRDAELLNAYVHDTAKVGDVPVTLSVGRQTLLWGESLLFPENGIAAAQAPVDEIKELSAPLAEAREVFLPVAQIVLRAELGDGFSLQAYDQLEWRRNRLPGVGSFFSTSDILDVGGQRFLAAADGLPTMYRTAGRGAARHRRVRHRPASFRGRRRLGPIRVAGGRCEESPDRIFDPANQAYHLAFPSGIEVYGASVSTYAGDTNLAGEISVHRNTPLDANAGLGPGSSLGSGYNDGIVFSPYQWPGVKPAWAGSSTSATRGTTINAQMSIQAQLPPNRFADGTAVQMEVAGNQLVSGTPPAGRTPFAVSVRAVLTPQFFQVRPGLDLSVPVGFGLGLAGRSSLDESQNAGWRVSVTVGVNAIVSCRSGWVRLGYTHFVGRPGSQPLADRRDFARTVSLARKHLPDRISCGNNPRGNSLIRLRGISARARHGV